VSRCCCSCCCCGCAAQPDQPRAMASLQHQQLPCRQCSLLPLSIVAAVAAQVVAHVATGSSSGLCGVALVAELRPLLH
jgi:hypothetical protein